MDWKANDYWSWLKGSRIKRSGRNSRIRRTSRWRSRRRRIWRWDWRRNGRWNGRRIWRRRRRIIIGRYSYWLWAIWRHRILLFRRWQCLEMFLIWRRWKLSWSPFYRRLWQYIYSVFYLLRIIWEWGKCYAMFLRKHGAVLWWHFRCNGWTRLRRSRIRRNYVWSLQIWHRKSNWDSWNLFISQWYFHNATRRLH